MFVAAKECNCTPWELEQQSVMWRDRALCKRAAEIDAKNQLRAMQDQINSYKENE